MRIASRFGIVLSTIAVAAVLAACGSSSGGGGAGSSEDQGVTDTTIKYGIISDQTGSQSVAQVPFAAGIETAFNEANEAGGVNEREIEAVTADDKSEVSISISDYKKFVSQNPVLGIAGPNASSSQEAVAPLARKDNMPLMASESTIKQGLVPFAESIFYIIPTYADQVDVMLGYMNDRLETPEPKVGILRIIAASGEEVDELVKERVDAAGGTVVADEEFDATATTAEAQMQKIVAADPDYIVFHVSPTQASLGLKAMEKFNAKIPVISTFAGGGTTAYESVKPEFGSLMQFTSGFTPASIEEPGTAGMVEAAQKAGFSDLSSESYFVIGYVAGKAIIAGLENAGEDLTRESYVEGLEEISELDTGGLSEAVSFTDTNHAGLAGSRPYEFDYDSGEIAAIGSFEDYTQYITNQYESEGE